MAIDDLKKGRGLAVIDPHGDLCEIILDYIPKSRIKTTLFTLSEVPNATLKDVPLLLTNASFRSQVVQKITDPTLKSFWLDEFDKMPPKYHACQSVHGPNSGRSAKSNLLTDTSKDRFWPTLFPCLFPKTKIGKR